MQPPLSAHFQKRVPSPIRLAQIEFMKRTDSVTAVNTAIGNVSLPMHPAMIRRMFDLKSYFPDGVVKYSASVGEKEARDTFLHLIASSDFSIEGLYSQITDGASQAMELAILGTCDGPLLTFDPVYPNYKFMAERTRRPILSVSRYLEENGRFSFPKLNEIETIIKEKHPAALLVIPYDNPSGQFFPQEMLNELGSLCAKYNLWMISDEAYRELFYTKGKTSSIWGVPGIQGRRISIESASKVWNACGLRIGALITDNEGLHKQSVAEYTANLSANSIGQMIFGALLHESKENLHAWFEKQRSYYGQMAKTLTANLKKEIPGLIVSQPDAALYTVIDVRKPFPKFNANDFVLYCAKKGKVEIGEKHFTLLLAPMDGFYEDEKSILGKTQMRIAYVESPENMKLVPRLLSSLLDTYKKIRGNSPDK